MSRTIRILAILLAAVATGMAYWVVLPKHKFAGRTTADAKHRPFLTTNNAWGVVRQLESDLDPSAAGRIHVVWSTYDEVAGDSVPKVFYRYTDDLGKTWSDSAPISRSDPATDSAYDATVAVIGDTVVVVWYEDYTEEEDEVEVKKRYILLQSNYYAGDPGEFRGHNTGLLTSAGLGLQ